MILKNVLKGFPLIISIIFLSADAESFNISGEQDGVYDKGEYVIDSDIVVKEGASLKLMPGAILRFKPYTGLIVKGDLFCEGSPALPVVFTSVKDNTSQAEHPAPFDWNGIEVEETSDKINLDFSRISYSTSGLRIKSNITDIHISNTVFKDNGNSNLIIEDKIVNVEDNVRFEYGSHNSKNTDIVNTETANKPEKRKKWKLPVRISLGTLVLASGIAAAVTHVKYEDYQKKIDNADNREDADHYYEKGKSMVILRNISYGIGFAAVAGFGVTFFF